MLGLNSLVTTLLSPESAGKGIKSVSELECTQAEKI